MDKKQLTKAILEEKRKRKITILAHVYQDFDVQEIADVTGDSFKLAQAAQNISNGTVIMCGVTFMAETVKILSPEKKVILAEAGAGCPMAEMLDPRDIEEYKKNHPECFVAAYINTTAQIKAVADVCVTSSSAVRILSKVNQKDILFIPDKNLGAYVATKLPDKNFTFMNGFCPSHNQITADDILKIKSEHPGVPVAIHPECPPEAVALCDFIGATTEITDFALKQQGNVIIVTERGVTDYLYKKYGSTRFIQAEPEKLRCDDMKLTTLQSVYDAITGSGGKEIVLPEELRISAKRSIDNMLKLG